IWDCLTNNLLPAYFNKKALYVIMALFISCIALFKKSNKLFLSITGLVFTGIIMFIILFYKAFDVHDYYLTNLLIFVPLPLITILHIIKNHYNKVYQSKILKTILIISAVLLIYETAVLNRMKYNCDDVFVKTNFVVHQGTVDFWKWHHHHHKNFAEALETITPYNRKLGLTRDDRVLYLSDNSINVALYLMDQKGFSNYGYQDLPFEERMDLYLRNGVEYIMMDSGMFKENHLQPYLNHKIGQYKNIGIFKIE
ncbi:MAG: hypothetical protein MI922_26780, partial [Bacteroidales bacterium]|nr:hypothetical protein [Bacteroidales bacterium]